MRIQLLCLVLGACPAAAQTVTDGDTIRHNGTIYRIWGIDAPETRQACTDGWMAGQAATIHMQGLIKDKKIECQERSKDRYGRTVALCRADGRDIGANMVGAGMAYAFVRYSLDYVAIEERARAARLGVHMHGCTMPWEWRARQRS